MDLYTLVVILTIISTVLTAVVSLVTIKLIYVHRALTKIMGVLVVEVERNAKNRDR